MDDIDDMIFEMGMMDIADDSVNRETTVECSACGMVFFCVGTGIFQCTGCEQKYEIS